MVLLAALLVAAGAVQAHARLLATSPAADAQLSTAPAAVKLEFDEPVRLAALRLERGGEEIPLRLERSAAPGSGVSVALPPLGAGRYRVHWSVVTVDDGHIVKGDFSFVVQDAS